MTMVDFVTISCSPEPTRDPAGKVFAAAGNAGDHLIAPGEKGVFRTKQPGHVGLVSFRIDRPLEHGLGNVLAKRTVFFLPTATDPDKSPTEPSPKARFASTIGSRHSPAVNPRAETMPGVLETIAVCSPWPTPVNLPRLTSSSRRMLA